MTGPATGPMIGPATRPATVNGRAIALRLAVPLALIGCWWAVSLTGTAGLFVASPAEALGRAVTDFVFGDATVAHLLPSLGRALAGFGLALLCGVGAGVAIGSSRVVAALFAPVIHLGRSLPSPALLGVFFFLFGTGDSPKIFLIAFSVVWPILFNTVDGVAGVGTTRMQAAAVFRIPRWDVLWHVVLPGAAPKIVAGARTALSLSLILMIISELQKSENGLGHLLVTTQRGFDYPGFWAVLVVLAILGVALNHAFLAVERRLLAWHRGATRHHG